MTFLIESQKGHTEVIHEVLPQKAFQTNKPACRESIPTFPFYVCRLVHPCVTCEPTPSTHDIIHVYVCGQLESDRKRDHSKDLSYLNLLAKLIQLGSSETIYAKIGNDANTF